MQYAFVLLLTAGATFAQPNYRESRVAPPPDQIPFYEIRRTASGIAVDGRANDADWAQAPAVDFVFPWNDTTSAEAQTTVARMLWDNENLYIVYVCKDPYLDSEVTAHDGPVYEEDAVEIFATPNPDNISAYFGYEMNINGALLDYMAFGGGEAWTENIHPAWQSEGVRIATSYEGTLNDHSDIDKGWILEIAIPLANFRHLGGHIPPRPGDTWRLNLNRTRGDKGQFSLWSDTHAEHPSFHHSAYFGVGRFSAKAAGE